ncbi:MAG TPA: nuclear transport factor 2 family protein, partial [Chryseolinea sp.]
MTLTKEVEAEIREVYGAFWESYLRGDVKTMGSFLSDDFTLIGTSDGEVFNNKKSAMKYLKATIDQVAGILSKKNIEIKIAKVDDTILVTEFFDAYVNTDSLPTFYGKFRATSVMKRVRGRWKIIHQHGSLPDSKAEVGETLATSKVKKENRELRDAVKRRTRELEQKNRDLEIEASLEKVRARTMAMRSSSELADLIAVIHSEIGRLDKNLDRSFILLFDDDGSSTWWMSGNEKMPLNRSYYMKHHKHAPYLACLKGWRKRERKWRYVLKGAEKKKWDDFIFRESELAQLPKVIKSNMAGAKVAHWSSSFNRYGCISTGSYEPLGASSFDLMVRFSRMFEQTYTRFLDLKKAEAQTREAQIELSLERVRARAMAMQSSTELGALIGMIYTELMRLDMNLNRCFIVLFDDTGNSTWWMASNESTDLNRGYFVPYSEHPFNLACLDGWRRQDLKWTYVLEGKGKKSWDEFIFGKTEMALVPRFIIDNMRAFGRAYVVAPFNKYGCIMAGSTSAPIPASSFDLLIKFSRTFEQTYTRFLDLKKAEAQARESQIQLALERVRARTMGMQHSDELQEAANLLFKQVQSLEIPVWSCGYNIWEKHEKVCTG